MSSPQLGRRRPRHAPAAGVWAAAAIASLCSTTLLAAAGYGVLAAGAGMLVVLPALTLVRRRHRPPRLTEKGAC